MMLIPTLNFDMSLCRRMNHCGYIQEQSNRFYGTQINLGSDLRVLVVLNRPFAILTDVTFADGNNNSIPADDGNRAIQDSVAIQAAPPGGQNCNLCKCKFRPMANSGTSASGPSDDPILNLCKGELQILLCGFCP